MRRRGGGKFRLCELRPPRVGEEEAASGLSAIADISIYEHMWMMDLLLSVLSLGS